LDHRVYPGARADLVQFEARPEPLREPQQRGDEAGRTPRLIGLRPMVEPGQKLRVPLGRPGRHSRVDSPPGGQDAGVHRFEPPVGARQEQPVETRRHTQRHRVLQAQPRPLADPPRQLGLRIQDRQFGPDYPRRPRRTRFLRVVGLPGDSLPNVGDLHQRLLSQCRCPLPCPCLDARAMSAPLTFAVPKGRILDEALPVMARAGVVPEAAFHDKSNRALSFATEDRDMRIIRVRAFDVATFVAFGAAQAGIVGSDVIEEFEYSELYAPVDLDFGHCRLSVAELKEAGAYNPGRASHLRVATKYPNITRRWFERQGIQAECVKLNGAMELAPSLGLSLRIVDLVSTGKTLADNGLVETDVIMPISARLIVNRAALKTDPRVAALVERFRALVDTDAA